MPWYQVTKRINGRSYLYLQMTYRDGGKVRTKNKYLGPAHGSARAFAQGAPSNLPTANEYPKVEKPAGGLRISVIHRLKPRTRAAINRAAAKRRLVDAARANLDQVKEAREAKWSKEEIEDLKITVRAQDRIYRQGFKTIYKRRLRVRKK